jgi:hypothetical protein
VSTNGRYRVGVKRAGSVMVALMLGGMAAMGCGGAASTAPSTTAAHPSVYAGSALSWLDAKARPWNQKLNDDQNAVSVDGAASEADPSDFFARLALACTRLAADADAAGRVQKAPTASLAATWKAMTARTAAYANDCLALTRTRSNADLTRWNSSLTSLNSANATLNAAVAAVRSASGESPG